MDDDIRNIISGGMFENVVQAGAIHGDINFHPRVVAQPIPRQLPPRRKGFTGRREQLDTLLGMLAPDADGDAVVVSAVAGLAGVGKTALALEAAHIAVERGWFAGGDLFLDLRGYDNEPITAEQALGELLRGLGIPPAEIRRGVEERARQFRSELANREAPVLLVADNASKVTQVQPLLVGDRRHRVLISSRHTLPQLDARLLDLGVLTPAESIELMRVALSNRYPEDTRFADEPAAADKVARLCGYLPLALRIITALLAATPGKPITELARELADERRRLDILDDQVDGVRAAFDLSYRGLSTDQARMFRLIPLNPGPDFSSDTAAALADTDETSARRVLDELARAHLIEPGSVRSRWGVHDLIRNYTAETARTDEDPTEYEQARDRLLDHYLRQAKAGTKRLRPQVEAEAEADREDALSWFDAEWANLLAAARMAADTGRDTIARDLPVSLGRYLGWRRRSSDALQLDIIRRDAALRLGDREGLAAAVDSIGTDLNELSRFEEAATTLRQAITLFREVGDRRGQGDALNHLGTALRGLRRFEESITACQQSTELLPERVGIGSPLDNLAMSLLAAGREREAAEVRERIARARSESDDPDILRNHVLWTNPVMQHILGDIRLQSERLNALWRELSNARHAGDRRHEGETLISLSEVFRTRGLRPKEAVSAAREAVTIFHELGDPGNESRALVALGRALSDKKE